MDRLFARSELADLIEKVERGVRLDFDEGVRLMKSKDILALGCMANLVRERKNADTTYFIVNRHINHTNVCVNLCKFCAYGVREGDPEAFTLSLEEIESAARKAAAENVSEVHVVGGLNPALPFDYYLEILRRIKRILPDVCLQAFTAVEVDYFTQITGLSVAQVLRELMQAGLDSLPGGGAEVFSPRVRALICEKKISGERWLEIQAEAHRLGMRTNATMLYGHVENAEERIDHLLQLRKLQDQTHGFLTFIPLPFYPKNTQLEGNMGVGSTTGFEDLRMLAAARIFLDNFDHIKSFWIMLGPKLAQVSLSFGVDDLDGTVVEERIIHAAGAETGQVMAKETLIRLIQKAGRTPVERDTLYRVRKSYELKEKP
ncbi:7,8-didemethyl-8-hydroxy-5-deazariboflavin synthase [Acididesulfobacillus acetoxydans]|uniref:Aminodeoxyfutalosine synthase n=1 Tax=Acididesulfobacillus acetoxydans TaxID=1561005 RepID=A0A8S0WGB4_9FIRM|nr:aminofutalosine synthase MqnE [Acididesulfobacillus acetoxydans]CAA7601742.1 7,8-didemethyl-8-hydroxy-5-deazariboflavin synthase [Acididesulfobacillus acetoxydans]CEJ09039.1 FO synthase subunit 2 2 [Acididesulfobacillus acetoxydans]